MNVNNPQSFYRSFFEHSIEAVFLTAPGGAIFAANHAACELFGRTEEEICEVGQSGLVDVSSPQLSKFLSEHAHTGMARAELVLVRRDGTRFSGEISSKEFVDDQGEKTTILAIRDLTNQKQSEQLLAESEARFRTLIDKAPVAIGISRNARTVYVNQKYLEMYGFRKEEELVGHLIGEQWSPESRLAIEERARLRSQGIAVPAAYEETGCRKDGSLFPVQVHAAIMELPDGPATVGFLADLTERKRAEDALKKSEERFQLSMEATSDGLWDWNGETNEVYYSPACYHMLGYEVGDVPSTLKGWQDLLHPDDLEHSMRVNMDCVEGRRETFAVEYRLKAKNGAWRWILGRGKSIVRDAQGRSLRLVGTNSDITERKQAEARILKLSRLYDTLSQVNTTIVHSANREDLFRNICKGAVEHGKFVMAWVGLVEEATHRVHPICHDGAEQGYLEDVFISADDIPEGHGPTGTSIRENRVCYINNFLADARIKPWSSAASKRGFLSSVGLPLRLKGKVIGALTMYSGEQDFFDAEQLALMDEMSADISFALDNFVREAERLAAEEKIADYLKKLESAMQGTLLAVSNMVEQRDPYTSGHERRVGIIAADIAREMGWPDDACKSILEAGLVHDIGKIAVPAELLSKPTRLTALEYEIVKCHAEKGYEILKDVEFPLPIAEIIRQHHERMDGSGYPRGLKGEDILPEARILAVADVLEAMASHRPYRAALGVEAAIKEIVDHRNISFDAAVVDAMLRLIREKGYQLP